MLGSLGFGGRGIGRPSVVKGAGGLQLPYQSDAFDWLDASDISTMWQEDTQTTPVSASGDDVGAWLSKGTNAKLWTQDVTASRPHYNDTIHSAPCLDFASATHFLENPSNSYSVTAGTFYRVFAFVGAWDAADANDNLMFHASSTQAQIIGDADLNFRMRGPGDSNTGTAPGAGVLVSGIKVIRPTNSQEMWANIKTGSTTTAALDAEWAGVTSMYLGGIASGQLDGQIAELAIWLGDDSDFPNIVADWKTYTNAKYGITWL